MAKFKKEILEIMKGDADLFSLLSKALKIKPTSLPIAIDRNGNSLNQFSIVQMVADYLKVDPKDLVEEVKKESEPVPTK